jgi:hypothetical protein
VRAEWHFHIGIIWEQQIFTVATVVNTVDGLDDFNAEGE